MQYVENPIYRASWRQKKRRKKRRKKRSGCFHGDTLLKKVDGTTIMFRNLKINDILHDGSVVISTHIYDYTDGELFNYGGILVTGDHMVYENNKWISVDESSIGFKTNISTSKVYCANTTSGELLIDGITFKDNNECLDSKKNKGI